MDDADYWPATLAAIAAVIGLGVGLEAIRYNDLQRRFFRWAMVAQLLVMAIAQANDLADLLMLIAAPIGCYKLGQMVAEPIGWWWRGRR